MAAEAFTRADGPGHYVVNRISRGPWDPNSLHARVLAGLFGHEVEIGYGGDNFHVARIRVVEVEYLSQGVSYARGTAVLLKRAENPTGTVWSPPDWTAPKPGELPEQRMGAGIASANWEPMWETRAVTSRDPQNVVQGAAWLRETRQLVEGVDLTPFVRAASAADWTNPAANWGSNGLGFHVASHHSADGIAVGECTMYDEEGAIGSSTVCAIAQRRKA